MKSLTTEIFFSIKYSIETYIFKNYKRVGESVFDSQGNHRNIHQNIFCCYKPSDDVIHIKNNIERRLK